MIINATVGTGFKGALLYVHKSEKDLKEEIRPEVIEKNNVIGSNPNLIAYQMREQAEQSGRVQKPVLHLSFSFAEEDKITKEKEVEAIKSAMNHFGVSEEKHQYVIVKHNDSDHKHNHYHAIINKVDTENKTLNTDWLHNKCSGIADRVEQEQNLHRVQGRQRIYDLEKDEYRYTTKEEKAQIVEKKQSKNFKEKAPKINEYQTKIQIGVKESLKNKEITNFIELQKDLAKKNIQTKLRLDDKTQEVKGISFRYDKKLSLKGGEIGYTSTIIANKLEENKAIQRQSTTIEPKAEPTPKTIEKPMQNDDREFTKEYNQRIEKVVNAHNSAYDKGEKPDTKAIFEENGFKKENDMFIFSNDDHRKEISGASFEQHSKLVQDIEIKQKGIDDEYKKTQEQLPEKVPLFIGKSEAIKKNEALKAKQKSPKIVMQKPRLRSQDFTIQSRTKLLQDRKTQETKLQQQKEERQAKQQNQSKGFKR